jgi:hypothetical protein
MNSLDIYISMRLEIHHGISTLTITPWTMVKFLFWSGIVAIYVKYS